ncbi:MAG TPA: peptidoglycan DD-metalloendopeptidase family protein [Candidatus Dormibacteraeota bacterium]
MRRLAPAALALAAVLLSTGLAWADTATSARTSPSPATGTRQASGPRVSPTPDPAVTALHNRIGADLTNAVAQQQKLSDAVAANTAREGQLNDQINAAQVRIDQLQSEIDQLSRQIDDTQARIDVEKGEIGALARALERRPSSLPLLFARSRNLGDVLRTGTELIVAGRRAHAMQTQLEADLARLQAERDARQADEDAETALQSSLQAQLDSLTAELSQQDEVSSALDDLLVQFRSALSNEQGLSSADLATLTDMLEQQQESLNLASVTQAWSAANAGAGRVQLLKAGLPSGGPTAHLATPIGGAVLTQPFGPTDLWFEPPLGQYAHFHTGVDLAAPDGTPVVAAADGIVVAVGSTVGGYGNYVILAHGGGLQTLYGHLDRSTVALGQYVTVGTPIGYEGSTGFSTGPHLHFEVRLNEAVVDPALYITLPAAA